MKVGAKVWYEGEEMEYTGHDGQGFYIVKGERGEYALRYPELIGLKSTRSSYIKGQQDVVKAWYVQAKRDIEKEYERKMAKIVK